MEVGGVDIKKAAVYGVITFCIFFVMGLIVKEITDRDIL
jgi:hypothetical protein